MGGKVSFTQTHHHQGECTQRARRAREALEPSTELRQVRAQSWSKSGRERKGGGRRGRMVQLAPRRAQPALSYSCHYFTGRELGKRTSPHPRSLLLSNSVHWQMRPTPEKLLLISGWNQVPSGRRTGRDPECLLLEDCGLQLGSSSSIFLNLNQHSSSFPFPPRSLQCPMLERLSKPFDPDGCCYSYSTLGQPTAGWVLGTELPLLAHELEPSRWRIEPFLQ